MTRDKHNRQKMALHRTALRAATRLKAMAQASPEAALSTTTTQPKGKASHTQYRLRAELAGGQAALLELRPGTGRTHQIRVHCAALGHPVLGDSSYGGGARRLAQLIQSFAPPRKGTHQENTLQKNTLQENTLQESSEGRAGRQTPPARAASAFACLAVGICAPRQWCDSFFYCSTACGFLCHPRAVGSSQRPAPCRGSLERIFGGDPCV